MSSDGSTVAFGAPTLNFAGGVFAATETNGTWALTATDIPPNLAEDADLGHGATAIAGDASAIISGAASTGTARPSYSPVS